MMLLTSTNRPRVILQEQRGKLVGLVTVKDILKYMAHLENAESMIHNGNDDGRDVGVLFERLITWITRRSNQMGNYMRLNTSAEEIHELNGRVP